MPEDLPPECSLKVFSDVRFVLLGFNPFRKTQVLSKLVSGGGVDAGGYGPDCTHVIVENLLYDDPACVAARSDGKALVNGLWVAQSFELGIPLGTDSILYKPPRDQKGIPGAQSLVMCLTGYQRQDREDIMTMVSLMGANFSKPLIASKVTHLICYKFDGDKYELAKKMKKIKIINHLWLEDCLKAWKILPEIDYDKSGYEMEILEAVAKDSEEADVTSKKYPVLNPKEPIRKQLDSSVSRDQPNLVIADNMAYAAGKGRLSDEDPNITDVPASVGNDFVSASGIGRSSHSDARKSSRRPTFGDTTQTIYSGEGTGSLSTGVIINTSKPDANDNVCSKSPSVGTLLHNIGKNSTPENTGRLVFSHSSAKSQKSGHNSKSSFLAGSQEMNNRDLLESASLISNQNADDQVLSDRDAHDLSPAAASTPLIRKTRLSSKMSPSAERKSAKFATPLSKTTNLETSQDAKLEKAVANNFAYSGKGSLNSDPKNRDSLHRQEHSCVKVPKNSSSRSQQLETERCNGPSDDGMHANAHCKPPVNKIYNRKTWSKGSTSKLRGCNYLNKSVPEDDPLSHVGVEETANCAANCIGLRAAEIDVLQYRNDNQRKLMSVDDEAEALVEKEMTVMKVVCNEIKTCSTGETDKSEDLMTIETDGVKSGMHGSKTSGNEKDGSKQEKVACGKGRLGESADMQIPVKENVSRRRKRSLSEQKNTVAPDKDTEEEVTEAVFEKNYGEAEAGMSEKQLGVHSKKAIDEDKDATKRKKATTRGKRKLAQSANLEKTVKENLDKRCRQNKINRKTVPFNACENEGKNELKETCEENAVEVEPDIHGSFGAEDKSEVRSCKTDSYALIVNSHTSAGEKLDDGAEHKETTCRKRKLGESIDMKCVKKSTIAEKKHHSRKIEKGKCMFVTKLADGAVAEGKKSGAASVIGDEDVSHRIKQSTNLVSNKVSRNLAAAVSNLKMQSIMDSKPEPVWFITSGDKPQRKEFQLAIRRLKGRVYKDSHKWSYQATHFIVPDPLRRTEKFFAAAASGRWILKADYISDSSKAGKFLAEEPYEWFKTGLSEDGSINLEAPRKWRLQRERTGYGAFIGMTIVIYGECIAPSLDTLKRVVKAGDGTILATSPPYTRFLESGIDFAVVSPSTPHTDIWAQEFLRHEIPCVVADYLVEFVCKPGYSLKEHVQFDTNDWAEKSLNKLVKQSKMNVQQKTPKNNGGHPNLPCAEATKRGDNDLPCQVCGSRGRREEMLICGHENNSFGWGIGLHIDCCDSALSNVPERDWLCSKCTKNKSGKRTPDC
ncbi:BRCT domain-containing protein At4g02110-like isoform X1 [Apium graveolens]|uniref:BRCT domain-containing protein At4g02110-like isoform X1 n=2 Tax=Apium graveolens TaxID=4045 RepID=UPI003D79A938